MSKATDSIQQKMTYMISRVEEGPLSSFEEAELLELLERAQNHPSIWGSAIRKDLHTEQRHELLAGLASQCADDLFTMVCILGQKAVIYLLRSLETE